MDKKESSPQKFTHISLQKTLCLLGVILAHVLIPYGAVSPYWFLYADESRAWAAALTAFLSALLVPSFIFASGFLMAASMERERRPFVERVKNRCKRLILPWFLTMLFWLVPLYTLFDIPADGRPAHTSLIDGYKAGLAGFFPDHLWFLLVLFWVTLFWLIMLPVVRRTNHLAGIAIAIAAAFLLERFAGGIKWYALCVIDAPIIYFYLGCLVYWHRERIAALNAKIFAAVLFILTAAVIVLPQLEYFSFAFSCFISCLCCIWAYILSLVAVRRKCFTVLQNNAAYRYFEKNSFRFYLFHIPTALLIFMLINPIDGMPVSVRILITFVLSMLVTGIIVAAGNWTLKKISIFAP